MNLTACSALYFLCDLILHLWNGNSTLQRCHEGKFSKCIVKLSDVPIEPLAHLSLRYQICFFINFPSLILSATFPVIILTAYGNFNNLKYSLFSVCQMALSILYYLVLHGYCFNKSLLSLLSAWISFVKWCIWHTWHFVLDWSMNLRTRNHFIMCL